MLFNLIKDELLLDSLEELTFLECMNIIQNRPIGSYIVNVYRYKDEVINIIISELMPFKYSVHNEISVYILPSEYIDFISDKYIQYVYYLDNSNNTLIRFEIGKYVYCISAVHNTSIPISIIKSIKDINNIKGLSNQIKEKCEAIYLLHKL